MNELGCSSNRRRSQRGLTLLEVLVSVVVAALFLGYLLPGTTEALYRARRADLEAQAVALARSQVERLSAWPAVEPKPNTGASGSLTWAVRETSVEAGSQGGLSAAVRTFRITVRSQDDAAPLVEMTVHRLGRAP